MSAGLSRTRRSLALLLMAVEALAGDNPDEAVVAMNTCGTTGPVLHLKPWAFERCRASLARVYADGERETNVHVHGQFGDVGVVAILPVRPEWLALPPAEPPEPSEAVLLAEVEAIRAEAVTP